jgi:hypothetical protein
MLKDIPNLVVKNLVVAIVMEENEIQEPAWNAYVVNLYDQKIETVIVSSKGYGVFEGRDVKTSVLRHVIGDIDPGDYARVEAIMPNLFGLNNEFWVSFYLDKEIYDKKYVFLPETIKEENFTLIPVLNKLGVMIR